MTPRLYIPPRIADARGWFCETFSSRAHPWAGIEFVQDNHSCSARRGTLRGIHFQRPPHTQVKLVRCVAGAVWDVTVDLRRGSPTYGRWTAATLTAEQGEQIFVPTGFGHGFLTLTDRAEVAYKVSDYYVPETEAGIRWDDPDLAIAWPLNGGAPILSPKDAALPLIAAFDSPFDYGGEPMVALT